jgi:hypothetical protein
LNIGDDGDKANALLAQLCGGIKAPDGLNFISEKFNTIGQLMRKRVNVDDTTTNSELTGLINEINLFKNIFLHELCQEINAELFTHFDFHGVALERFLRDDFLMDRLRISDYNKMLSTFIDPREDFSPVEDTVIVRLIQLIGFLIGGGVEDSFLIAQNIFEIILKIGSFFTISENK